MTSVYYKHAIYIVHTNLNNIKQTNIDNLTKFACINWSKYNQELRRYKLFLIRSGYKQQ